MSRAVTSGVAAARRPGFGIDRGLAADGGVVSWEARPRGSHSARGLVSCRNGKSGIARSGASSNRLVPGGFTLLEVLVALIVLSVGLLGLSGLQTTSLRNNHSAFLRSQATLVTHDIIDRMRANRTAATAGNYDIAYGGTASSVSCTGSCTPLDVAQMDVGTWRDYVERLPAGEGELTVTGTGIAEVKVRWSDARSSATADKLELVTKVLL